jgi:ABC-2 type transport system ATP-binding protein
MRSIIGLLEPTYGDIEVAGVNIREKPEEANRKVAFMPDFPPIYEDLRVWEFLDLFAASYYVPKSERPEIIDRYLHLVDLYEKRDAFIPGLSRGMRQRLMLAKTLIPDPEVIILDEPASGVDPHGRILLKNIFKQLSQAGKTLLVSSHILSEMSEFCTAIGIMERGKMVESGTVQDVSRRVMGHALVSLELLHPEQEELLRSVLSRDSKVGKLESLGQGRWEIGYEGEEQETADLLKKLVTSDLQIISFGRKKEALEDIFLKIGAKEVS